MNKSSHKFYLNCLISILFMLTANVVFADPPTRVARISYISGAVSFQPAGEKDWVDAKLNRPLTTGSHLWADKDAKAELQLGAAAVRIDQNTSITLLNLDDNTAQFQLAQGVVNLRVWHIKDKQIYEIDTPNLAFSVKEPGSYRLEVSSDGKSTIVSVDKGEGSVYGEKTGFQVAKGQSCSFSGTDLAGYQCSGIAAADNFDQWVVSRDHRTEKARVTHHVSEDVIGQEDLQDHGDWHQIHGYGDAWSPNDMPSGWAPYSDGHWAWVNPWGWTWIDDASWGFAPYHYGRWVYYEDHWYWVPGPVVEQPVYAPALVVFIGGGFAGGSMGWFPLSYGEVYIPPYQVSRRYFGYINRSNTHIMPGYLNNVYAHRNLVLSYHNQHVANAVTAVPKNVFQKSQPVAKNKIVVTPSMINQAKVVPTAKIAPEQASVIGLHQTQIKPPQSVITRPVVVKTPPPPPPVPFAAMQKQLAANPGKPLTPEEINTIRPTVVTPAPEVKVITPPTKPIMPIAPNKPIVPSKPSLQPTITPTTGPKLKPIPPGEFKPFVPPKHIVPITPPGHRVTPEVIPTTPKHPGTPPAEYHRPLEPVNPPEHHVSPQVIPVRPPRHHVTPPVEPIAPVEHHYAPPAPEHHYVPPVPERHYAPPPPPPPRAVIQPQVRPQVVPAERPRVEPKEVIPEKDKKEQR